MTRDVTTLAADESLALADEVMRLKRIRHIPVVRGKRLLGLISHRDLLQAQARLLLATKQATEDEVYVSVAAEDIMTKDVVTVHPDMRILEASDLLLDQPFGCLPVVENDGLVGIVTEADLLRWAVRQLREQSSRETDRPDPMD
ncbi:MAG: CBS domain-containing protein [Sandaracinaceae bacterium]|nr:CBS domain-containing protein [Myxococcales bacterium]MCB9657672.1 CBS domain-containing protein [Sandaracinaceae bacterium]